jgi:hypothetical protein
MATDTFQAEFVRKPANGGLAMIAYIGIFVGYTIIFVISLFTVGFLEIRQANMGDFNALIAVLEERDGYADGHLNDPLKRAQAERDFAYWASANLHCRDSSVAANVKKLGRAMETGDPRTSTTDPETCAQIKEALRLHANELSVTEGEIRFRQANFPFYYDQYKDGITQKTPQIIPALRLLDSEFRWLTLWARSPFELIEMFLLVCMGMLGGAISVMRSLVDTSLEDPTIAEFFYKPAAGAAISLGVYVLFRAAQIFLGVQSSPATVSTSIFLLAGLGLASGFCATEALAQIESVAKRLLRASNHDADRCRSTNNA